MRIVCLLAVGVVLVGLATLPASRVADAAASASNAMHAGLGSVGAIFGEDENEPDENEADEGSGAHQRPAGGQAGHSSSTSLLVVLLIAALGVFAAAFVANRLRRLWARVRGVSARLRELARL